MHPTCQLNVLWRQSLSCHWLDWGQDHLYLPELPKGGDIAVVFKLKGFNNTLCTLIFVVLKQDTIRCSRKNGRVGESLGQVTITAVVLINDRLFLQIILSTPHFLHLEMNFGLVCQTIPSLPPSPLPPFPSLLSEFHIPPTSVIWSESS